MRQLISSLVYYFFVFSATISSSAVVSAATGQTRNIPILLDDNGDGSKYIVFDDENENVVATADDQNNNNNPSPSSSPTWGPTAVPTIVPTTDPTANPTVFPTMGPTASPSIAPTSSPTPPPPPPPPNPYKFCFSGNTWLTTRDGRHLAMNQVQIGDVILVNNNKYEQVYAFGHANPTASTNMIQLLPSGLELTPNHMVWVHGLGYVSAEQVKVGDTLLSTSSRGKQRDIVVSEIRHVVANTGGVFTPYTPSGTIVVNGILSSNYIAFQNTSRLGLGSIPQRHQTPFTFHWLCHSFLTVQRIWCLWVRPYIMSTLVSDDKVTQTKTTMGISEWARRPLIVAEWYIRQNAVVMGMLLVPFVTLLACLNLMEITFILLSHTIGSTQFLAVGAVLVGLSYCIYIICPRRGEKKTKSFCSMCKIKLS